MTNFAYIIKNYPLPDEYGNKMEEKYKEVNSISEIITDETYNDANIRRNELFKESNKRQEEYLRLSNIVNNDTRHHNRRSDARKLADEILEGYVRDNELLKLSRSMREY